MFHKNLKELRLSLDLTQKEVAKAINISPRTLGYYENGERFPNKPEILLKIADYFDVSIDYLLGRAYKNYLTKQSNNNKINLNNLISKFINIIETKNEIYFNGNKLSKNDKEKIISIIRILNKK